MIRRETNDDEYFGVDNAAMDDVLELSNDGSETNDGSDDRETRDGNNSR